MPMVVALWYDSFFQKFSEHNQVKTFELQKLKLILVSFWMCVKSVFYEVKVVMDI